MNGGEVMLVWITLYDIMYDDTVTVVAVVAIVGFPSMLEVVPWIQLKYTLIYMF